MRIAEEGTTIMTATETKAVWRCRLCPDEATAFWVPITETGATRLSIHLTEHHRVADRIEYVTVVQRTVTDEPYPIPQDDPRYLPPAGDDRPVGRTPSWCTCWIDGDVPIIAKADPGCPVHGEQPTPPVIVRNDAGFALRWRGVERPLEGEELDDFECAAEAAEEIIGSDFLIRSWEQKPSMNIPLGCSLAWEATPAEFEDHNDRYFPDRAYSDPATAAAAADLRTPADWQLATGIRIADPDGWRVAGDPSWETPISREDFLARAQRSTVLAWPRPLYDEPAEMTVAGKIDLALARLRDGNPNPKVRVLHRSGQQRFPRESVLVLLGEGDSSHPSHARLTFSARPVAGTTELRRDEIIGFDIVAQQTRPYVNKVRKDLPVAR